MVSIANFQSIEVSTGDEMENFQRYFWILAPIHSLDFLYSDFFSEYNQ